MNLYDGAHASNPEFEMPYYRQECTRCQAAPRMVIARCASAMNKYS